RPRPSRSEGFPPAREDLLDPAVRRPRERAPAAGRDRRARPRRHPDPERVPGGRVAGRCALRLGSVDFESGGSMINALLLLWVAGQDADVALTGSGRRTGGEYELKVAGTGKALKEGESVSLRFRRIANRVEWATGSLRTIPVDDEV